MLPATHLRSVAGHGGTHTCTHTARALCVRFCLITHPIALLAVCYASSRLSKTLRACWRDEKQRTGRFTQFTQPVYPQVKVGLQASSIMEGVWQYHLWDAEGRCHFKAMRSGIIYRRSDCVRSSQRGGSEGQWHSGSAWGAGLCAVHSWTDNAFQLNWKCHLILRRVKQSLLRENVKNLLLALQNLF